MLVLKRQLSESVVVGHTIVVTVVAIGPGWVKLGFVAPPEVAVHRTEVERRIQDGEERKK